MIRVSPVAASFLRQIYEDSRQPMFNRIAAEVILTDALHRLTKKEREELTVYCEQGRLIETPIPEPLLEEFKALAGLLKAFRPPEERERIRRRIRMAEG